jgi:hypothetical protein
MRKSSLPQAIYNLISYPDVVIVTGVRGIVWACCKNG